MAVRKRKPTSAGRRFQSVSDFAEITKDRPEKSLLAPKPSTGGRNSYNNVEFLGFGDATVTTGTANQTGARAFKFNNSTGESTFRD